MVTLLNCWYQIEIPRAQLFWI